jgi:hypothetical protein
MKISYYQVSVILNSAMNTKFAAVLVQTNITTATQSTKAQESSQQAAPARQQPVRWQVYGAMYFVSGEKVEEWSRYLGPALGFVNRGEYVGGQAT